MTNLTRSNFQDHPYHLVSPSPWPILTCLSLFALTTSGVLSMQGFIQTPYVFFCAFTCLLASMAFWFRDVISEATYMGDHTSAVQRGLNMGVIFFIVSEALFFLAIFWTFFHSALSPALEIGAAWPPKGIEAVNSFELPLLNTMLLLSSGFTVTYGHHCVICGNRKGALNSVILTVVLAIAFTCFQGLEYTVSSFTISDSVYGSCFYFGTGFHGLHVVIGTLFIGVGLWRTMAYHYTRDHHLGLESSIIYWHFVDVVWLFLFISVYYWGC